MTMFKITISRNLAIMFLHFSTRRSTNVMVVHLIVNSSQGKLYVYTLGPLWT